MRLWSLHPRYLDRMGLLAVWREGLLARKVLEGKTKGYRSHPQLQRFKSTKNPVASASWYLKIVAGEASLRGYHFDVSKLGIVRKPKMIPVTSDQLSYEFSHLLKKLKIREPVLFQEIRNTGSILPHPLFLEIPGPVEPWEKRS